MKTAITGATGFIGRYIVVRLASSGYSLRCWHRPLSDLTGLESQNVDCDRRFDMERRPESGHDEDLAAKIVTIWAAFYPLLPSRCRGTMNQPWQSLFASTVGFSRWSPP